jgi:hypothetical protein
MSREGRKVEAGIKKSGFYCLVVIDMKEVERTNKME